jgi:FdhD protein
MPNSFQKYQAVSFKNGKHHEINDEITIEKALQISINSKPFTVVMQTPGDEINLSRGLLFSEDVLSLNSKPDFETKNSKDDYIEEVNWIIPENELGDGFKSSRSLLSVSSCGICGKQELETIENISLLKKNELENDMIFDLQKQMNDNQPIFKTTGSTHGSALFNSKGDLLVLKEDIGRHNALDKAIGSLINSDNLKEAKILFFSGRLSFEIIFKSFRAKIPTIVAVSAPSSLAIDYAKEFGITIYGFCRENRFTRYS